MIKKDVAGRSFASFGRTRTKNIKLLLGVLMAAAVLTFWTVWRWKSAPNPDDLSFKYFIYPLIILVGGAAKILYDMYLDMPYLHFTEDQFYFDQDGKETRYYWRDVVDVTAVTLMDRGVPKQDKAIVIVMKDKSQMTIDPASVDFKGADIGAIAKEFWQSALAKIG